MLTEIQETAPEGTPLAGDLGTVHWEAQGALCWQVTRVQWEAMHYMFEEARQEASGAEAWT